MSRPPCSGCTGSRSSWPSASGWRSRTAPVETIRLDVRTDGPGGPAAVERLLDGFRTVPGWAVVVTGDPATAADAKAETKIKLLVTPGDAAAGRNRLRTAKTDLVVTPPADAGQPPEYLVEPNRPESVLARKRPPRGRWMRAASARPCRLPRESISRLEAPGGRYIDFLHPRPAGHQPDGRRAVGGRVRGGGHAGAEAAQAVPGHPHAAERTSCISLMPQPAWLFTLVEIVLLMGFGVARLRRSRCRATGRRFAGLCGGRRVRLRRRRTVGGVPGQDHRDRQRPDERRHAADVPG